MILFFKRLYSITLQLQIGIFLLVSPGCSAFKAKSHIALQQEWVAIPLDTLQVAIDRVDALDVNRDGFPDLLAGPRIYINPHGKLLEKWHRIHLDPNITPYFFFEVDNDGLPDIIGLRGTNLYWIEALDPEGIKWSYAMIAHLSIHSNANGFSIYKGLSKINDNEFVVFNFNKTYFFLDIPDEPEERNWVVRRMLPDQLVIGNNTDNLHVIDLDLDGDSDTASFEMESMQLIVHRRESG